MELTEKQYQHIAALLPRQRGNVKIPNRTLLNALLYRCENGCKWRALPERFGNWHSIYMRMSRWAESGVLERVYRALAAERILGQTAYALDSTAAKAHPAAHGPRKKRQAVDREEPGRVEHEDTRGDGGRQHGRRHQAVRGERRRLR